MNKNDDWHDYAIGIAINLLIMIAILSYCIVLVILTIAGGYAGAQAIVEILSHLGVISSEHDSGYAVWVALILLPLAFMLALVFERAIMFIRKNIKASYREDFAAIKRLMFKKEK